MSMCMYLQSGAMREVQRLARDPEALAAIAMSRLAGGMTGAGGAATRSPSIQPQALEATIELMREQARRAGWRHRVVMFFLARQLRRQAARIHRTATTPAGTQSDVLDLHKSWDLLHFLLTGSADSGPSPANTLLAGGQEIGEDLGYGPARVLEPASAKAFAHYLDTVSVDDLQGRIDPQRMAEVGIYGADGEDDLVEEIAHYLPMLQGYVGGAATRGDGLVIWLM